MVIRGSPPATLPLKALKFCPSVDPWSDLRVVRLATDYGPGPWIEAPYSSPYMAINGSPTQTVI